MKWLDECVLMELIGGENNMSVGCKRNRIFYSLLLCGTVFVSHLCGQVSSGISDGERPIVCDAKIDIVDPGNAEGLSDLKYYLKLRFPLKPTDPRRAKPSLSAYSHKLGERMTRPKWLKNFILSYSSPFTRYDSTTAFQGVTAMENYLYNQGYLRAKAYLEVEREDNCVELKYVIHIGPRYKLNAVKFEVLDSNLLSLKWEIEHNSLLKQGAPVTDELFYRERARIVEQIKNEGFAFFNASYIRPKPADTFAHRVNLTIDIVPPAKDSLHEKYRIGDVHVYADYDLRHQSWKDTFVHGLIYHFRPGRRYVRPSVLERKIKLRSGGMYTFDDEVHTFDGLNRIAAYKLVTIDKSLSKNEVDVLNYTIHLSPAHKYEFERSGGLTYSRFTDQQTFLNIKHIIRPNFDLSLKDRNFRNRGISMQYYLNGDAELYFRKNQETNNRLLAINSYTLESGLSATLPNYTSFPGTFDLLYRSKLISPWFYNEIKERAQPEFRFNFGLISLPSFYSSAGANIDFGYRFRASDEANITIRTLGLDYYSPKKGTDFDTIIKNNQFLSRSILGQRLFTSVFFKYFGYSFTRAKERRAFSWGSNGFLEQSGLELFLSQLLLQGILRDAPDITRIRVGRDTLQFSSFLRIGGDYKAYYHFTRETYLAFRVGPALAIPFGHQVVPYVKQYFVGGPFSIRAWDIRSLGPGTANLYQDTLLGYYSTGDIKLDLNLELRFPTYTFTSLKGAVFLDAANVWALRSDDPEKRFSKDFYRQLALGTGLGLRLDLEWFVIRGDVGVKLMYPYEVNGSRWFFRKNNVNNRRIKDALTYNLAIGYPF